ncbi:MAG: alpha-glucosidase C-terminal domain-containing protein [Bacteroidetes bacterium]|nr:alpha-glucosidase C-terminal domain-containing protein [Bacteroidota bacterium]
MRSLLKIAGLFVILLTSIDSFAQLQQREFIHKGVIYEIDLRSFTPEGTINAFELHLPRLKAMGVDILLFKPLFEIGVKNRKGKLGESYSVKDFTEIGSSYGNMKDLTLMVTKAHRLGMYVILDWVSCCASWDNSLINEQPDWFIKDEEGKLRPVSNEMSDVVSFNFEQKRLWRYMADIMKTWIELTAIDGFRMIMSSYAPNGFLGYIKNEINSFQKCFFIVDKEDPELNPLGIATYSLELNLLFEPLLQSKKNADHLFKKIAADNQKYKQEDLLINHTTTSWLNTQKGEPLGNGIRAFAVLTFTLPGIPSIYNGQESDLDRSLRSNEKDQIDWKNYSSMNFYSILCSLRGKHRSTWAGSRGGNFVPINCTDKRIVAFTRQRDADVVHVIINLSAEKRQATLNGISMPGNFKDIFTGKGIELGKTATVELEPWGYMVLEKFK